MRIPLFFDQFQHRVWSKPNWIYNGFSIVGCEIHVFLQRFQHRFQSESNWFYNGFSNMEYEVHVFLQWFQYLFEANPTDFTMVSASWDANFICFYNGFSIASETNPIDFTVVPTSWGVNSIVFTMVSACFLKQISLILSWCHHHGVRIPLSFTMDSAPFYCRSNWFYNDFSIVGCEFHCLLQRLQHCF